MRIFAHHISKTNQPIMIGIGMMDLIDRYISQEQIKKAQYYKNQATRAVLNRLCVLQIGTAHKFRL